MHQRQQKAGQSDKRRHKQYWKNSKGFKSIGNTKSAKKKVHTPKIRDEKDEIYAKGKHDEDEGIHDEETTK